MKGKGIGAIDLDRKHSVSQTSTIVPQSPVLDRPSVAPEPAEALIKEARHRQRRRHHVIVSVALVALLTGSLTYLVVRATMASVPISTTGAASTSTVPAGRFVGTFHIHTYYVYLHADGRGSARWPIDVRCGTGPGEGPPPCDTWIATPVTSPDGSPTTLPNGTPEIAEHIVDGGHATLRLTSVSSTIARGIVTASSEQGVLPDGPATFKLTKNDLLYLTPHRRTGASPFGRSGLCGSEAQVARGIFCD
jgi:hypothetical protein